MSLALYRFPRYAQSCKTASRGQSSTCLSMVTDKGDAGALPLQFSACAWPDNMAFVCVPVVTGPTEKSGKSLEQIHGPIGV